VLRRQVVEYKARQGIISHSASVGGRVEEPRSMLAAVAALGPELISQGTV
jgi:hypothetical protein